MKIKLELNIPGDGRVFLNYWDYLHGDDVVCELVNDKLMLSRHDVDGNETTPIEITLQGFIDRVKYASEQK